MTTFFLFLTVLISMFFYFGEVLAFYYYLFILFFNFRICLVLYFFSLFFISAISRYWHFSYSRFTSVITCFGSLWHLILDVRFCRYFCYHPVSLVRSYYDFLTVFSFLEGHNVFFFG